MAQINLLPWRAQLRTQRLREFGVMILLGLLLSVLVMSSWHFYNNSLIGYQNERNRYLNDQIQIVDRQLRKIRSLEKTKRELINRMKVVASLQSSRPQIVHLFDELVKTLPDGVYLQQVTQSGSTVTVRGEAQSNARVSAYMRAIDASPWLTAPSLKVIEQKGSRQGDATFELTMKQTEPGAAKANSHARRHQGNKRR